MYLSGKLEIDPSQITEIKKLKQASFFSKFLDVLTFGQTGEKQETETFTAVSILEKIYLGLRSINVDNIIRLSVDEYDFYYDEQGKADDLEEAVFEFTAKVDPIESQLFNTVYLVMEHDEGELKYLIEIRIQRKHGVGEYPIIIIINAVSDEFEKKENESIEDLKIRMKPIFEDQNVYDTYLKSHKSQFDSFMSKMEMAVRKFVEVDDVIHQSNLQIIRTKSRVSDKTKIRHDRFSKPVYYGYYGFDNYFFYTWLWGSLMYDHNIYAHDFYLVDELGHEILHVGEDGFNSAEYATLNPDVPFEPISNADVEYFSESEYADDIKNQGIEIDNAGDSEEITDDSFDSGDKDLD